MINKSLNNLERVEMDFGGLFWTRQNEMIEEIEELDYIVTEVNWEYVTVTDMHDDEENCYILYLGHANSTMWIESIRAMD